MTVEARLEPKQVVPRRLDDLIAEFDLSRSGGGATEAITLTGVASDNRAISKGSLFAALPGAHAHGAQFTASAIENGAVAVLTDDDGARWLAEHLPDAAVPVVTATNLRSELGPIASWVYSLPSSQMQAFGVTGTNGKTTCIYLINHLLSALGNKTGIIGTIEMRAGDQVLPSKLTTPDAADLQAILATMVEGEVDAIAMEVSSHALELHRVDGIKYAVAGFTNLSQDHLDFHLTMEGYFAAKAKLFTPSFAERGVVIIDEPWGRKFATASQIPVLTLATEFGDGEYEGITPDWTVTQVKHLGSGSAFTLTETATGAEIETYTELPGSFNVQNAALALVMVLASGVTVSEVEAALAKGGGMSAVVPGRMEVISPGDETSPRVIVDFAHNTEALRQALVSLRGGSHGRLFVLFGAAGERDQGKRAAMGAAAVTEADVIYLTDDDPHGEDPEVIRAAVRQGAHEAVAVQKENGRHVEVVEVPDRKTAIRDVIAAAGPGDTVLLAGRGHETTQPLADHDLALDDRVEARSALAALGLSLTSESSKA